MGVGKVIPTPGMCRESRLKKSRLIARYYHVISRGRKELKRKNATKLANSIEERLKTHPKSRRHTSCMCSLNLRVRRAPGTWNKAENSYSFGGLNQSVAQLPNWDRKKEVEMAHAD